MFVDNLFTSLDLLEHMGDKGLGVTGTMRVNRLHGIPLPTKKEAQKMARGEYKAVYTQDMCVLVWKDSVPVFMCIVQQLHQHCPPVPVPPLLLQGREVCVCASAPPR